MMVEKVPDGTYEIVGGLNKQIKEVIELPAKHPELFEALGIAQQKGVLLDGPPPPPRNRKDTLGACGGTSQGLQTYSSQRELVQKYIGEGSWMVRGLFVMATEHAPSIIFMDEIDSIAIGWVRIYKRISK